MVLSRLCESTVDCRMVHLHRKRIQANQRLARLCHLAYTLRQLVWPRDKLNIELFQ